MVALVLMACQESHLTWPDAIAIVGACLALPAVLWVLTQ